MKEQSYLAYYFPMSKQSAYNISHSWGSLSINLIPIIIIITMYSKSKSLLIDRIGSCPLSCSNVSRFSQQPSNVIPLYKNGISKIGTYVSIFKLLPVRVSIILGNYNMKFFISFSFSKLILGPRLWSDINFHEHCVIFIPVAKSL